MSEQIDIKSDNKVVNENINKDNGNEANNKKEAEQKSNSGVGSKPEPSIYQLLATARVPNSDVPTTIYERAVYIPRSHWTLLGDYISYVEKLPVMKAGNDKHISLRLDIRSMSKLRNKLLRLGLFESKFDSKFANLMISIATALAEEFNAKIAYTQSDEITIIISPAVYTQPSKTVYDHPYSGKRDKLISLSASYASSIANKTILQWYINKFNASNSNNSSEAKVIDVNEIPILQFDCRLGCWDSYLDALQLILWRCYDTGVNGISDAIHHNNKSKSGLPTNDKLDYLYKNNLLPLHPHQSYGTLIYKTKQLKQAYNPITKQQVLCERTCFIQHKQCNIINLLKKYNFNMDNAINNDTTDANTANNSNNSDNNGIDNTGTKSEDNSSNSTLADSA